MPTRISSFLSRILLITLVTGVTFSSHAGSLSCESLFNEVLDPIQVIKKAFSDKSTYHPFGCAGNVGRLLLQLSSAQDISQAKVIFLLHEKGTSSGIPMKMKLKPMNVREDINVWNYHTVLLSKGEIIDLHSKPFPLPMQAYFSRHFPENANGKRWKGLMLQSFPADQYMKAYLSLEEKNTQKIDQIIAVMYLNKPNTPESPLLSLSDFLLQQETPFP